MTLGIPRWLRGSPVAAGLLFSVAATLACLPPPAGNPDPDPEPEPEPGPATTSDELFSLDRLPEFHITLDAAAKASLEDEPKDWVMGEFEYAGKTWAEVGVRLKGNHSFRPLSEKASFKVKFNKFHSERRFLGLEALTLNSMVVDRSMVREWIAYRVFRALGVAAPRAGYAQVWVNDELYGLYLDLEPYDDPFLRRVYADATGNLYESDKSADLDSSIEAWDQDEGKDTSRDDLAFFSALALEPGTAVFYGDQALVDLPEFFAFVTGETIVGHFDGHIGGHNFSIYHEPTLDLWTYQPWSLDQALIRHVTPYEHEGYLAYKCLHEEECLVDYVTQAQQLLGALRELDLQADVDRVIELTDEAMRADPRRPYTEAQVESSRTRSLDYILSRADELEPQLDCLVDGVQPDLDQDDYGPCFQDCDETDPEINPDAEELCDGIDNNCSGFADDVPACPCPSLEVEGRTFYLCLNDISWLEARSFCEDQGHVLAHFDSPEQSDEVWEAAEAIDPGRWAIGLNDRSEENDYRWIDGSAPEFELWGQGQPAHQLDWFDCVFLRNHVWIEANCIEDGSFLCSDD